MPWRDDDRLGKRMLEAERVSDLVQDRHVVVAERRDGQRSVIVELKEVEPHVAGPWGEHRGIGVCECIGRSRRGEAEFAHGRRVVRDLDEGDVRHAGPNRKRQADGDLLLREQGKKSDPFAVAEWIVAIGANKGRTECREAIRQREARPEATAPLGANGKILGAPGGRRIERKYWNEIERWCGHWCTPWFPT